jgi:hypothetical protein
MVLLSINQQIVLGMLLFPFMISSVGIIMLWYEPHNLEFTPNKFFGVWLIILAVVATCMTIHSGLWFK